MNDRLPTSVTSPPIASALPDGWISRIFSKLEGRYGSLFIDRWRDCDMANVRETWAEELAGFRDKPEAIAYALRALSDQPFPPTLPEFLAACRRAPAKDAPALLPHKPTPEQRQHQHELAKRLGDVMGAKKIADGIDEHWATHPRSQHHLRFIFDAAANDKRFGKCIDQMVADGICTADGKLLRSYSGGTWQAAA